MTGDNVQHHDDVAQLPWSAAFAMSCPPESAPVEPIRRRRADTRTLADVVATIALEQAA